MAEKKVTESKEQTNAPLPQEELDAKVEAQAKETAVEPVDGNVGSATYEPLDQKSLEIQTKAQADSFESEKDTLGAVKELPPSGPVVKDQHVELAEESVKDVAAGDVDAEIATLEVQKRAAGVGSNLYSDLDAKIQALKAKKK